MIRTKLTVHKHDQLRTLVAMQFAMCAVAMVTFVLFRPFDYGTVPSWTITIAGLLAIIIGILVGVVLLFSEV